MAGFWGCLASDLNTIVLILLSGTSGTSQLPPYILLYFSINSALSFSSKSIFIILKKWTRILKNLNNQANMTNSPLTPPPTQTTLTLSSTKRWSTQNLLISSKSNIHKRKTRNKRICRVIALLMELITEISSCWNYLKSSISWKRKKLFFS